MTELTWIATAVFLIAGICKGIVGMGLPTFSIGILSQVTDPRTAISLAIAPIVITNIWQLYRAGSVLRTVKRYAPFVVALCLLMIPAALLSGNVPVDTMLLFVGCSIILFVLDSLRKTAWQIPASRDTLAQVIIGGAGGVLGGVSGIWSPAMVGYLLARRVDKDEFIRALGYMMLTGGLFLSIGYYKNGFLTPQLLIVSLLLVPIAIVGFSIGERLRSRLSAGIFRKAVLLILLLLGLNLVRRALVG